MSNTIWNGHGGSSKPPICGQGVCSSILHSSQQSPFASTQVSECEFSRFCSINGCKICKWLKVLQPWFVFCSWRLEGRYGWRSPWSATNPWKDNGAGFSRLQGQDPSGWFSPNTGEWSGCSGILFLEGVASFFSILMNFCNYQVSGELSNNGQPMRRFVQTFVLAPQSAKKYYVRNDIFRYQVWVQHVT